MNEDTESETCKQIYKEFEELEKEWQTWKDENEERIWNEVMNAVIKEEKQKNKIQKKVLS